jgi:hypothetical protein
MIIKRFIHRHILYNLYGEIHYRFFLKDDRPCRPSPARSAGSWTTWTALPEACRDGILINYYNVYLRSGFIAAFPRSGLFGHAIRIKFNALDIEFL